MSVIEDKAADGVEDVADGATPSSHEVSDSATDDSPDDARTLGFWPSRRVFKWATAVIWVVCLGVLASAQLTGSSPLPFLDGGQMTNSEVIERLQSLVADLPVDEQPIVATIEDVDALVEIDGFYAGASDGDRLVVYPLAERAIIYSVEQDELVRDGTLSK